MARKASRVRRVTVDEDTFVQLGKLVESPDEERGDVVAKLVREYNRTAR
jgi:hypothetical protein